MDTDLEIGVNEGERARYRRNGLGIITDPHVRYDELRAQADVHPGTIPDFFDAEDLFAGAYGEDAQFFSLFGFDVCYEAFRDNETFSSKVYWGPTRLWRGPNLVALDEPEHHPLRALAQPAFAVRAMENWERRWMMPIVDRLISSFVGKRRVDLYMEFCAKIPAHTICKAFGVPDRDIDMIHSLAVSISGQANPTGGEDAAEQFAEYVLSIIRSRRDHPEDDVVTYLVESETGDPGDRRHLTDEELLGLCTLMLTAGTGTTYRTLGMGLLALLRNPDLLERVRQDRSLIPLIVEETLRWEPPVTWLPRQAVRDTELGGVKIPAGGILDVAIGPANRDPRRWDDPHVFNPFRKKRPHIGFGTGPHFCIGNQLARMELRVAMNQLFDRLPTIRLDPEAEAPFITGLYYRMPTAVPVILGD